MKRGIFAIGILCLMLPVAFALNPIKVGEDEITPFLDAVLDADFRYGGTTNFVNGMHKDYVAEVGVRYEHPGKDYNVQSNISLIDGYLTEQTELGDFNFGILKGNHQLFVGQGTYPFSIILKNHHFNNRYEAWAPTTMSIFAYNCLGEYKRAIYYQYNINKFKVKTGLFEDKPIYTDEGYRSRRLYTPVVALNYNLTKDIELEQTYSNFKGKSTTSISSIGVDIPKGFRLEFEYLRHKRDNYGFNVVDSPDSDIQVDSSTNGASLPAGMSLIIGNLEYETYTTILTHTSFIGKENKQLILFAENTIIQTDNDYDFVMNRRLVRRMHNADQPDGNQTIRLGANYQLAPCIYWTNEWEHNTIDVDPQWEQRITTALRIKL